MSVRWNYSRLAANKYAVESLKDSYRGSWALVFRHQRKWGVAVDAVD